MPIALINLKADLMYYKPKVLSWCSPSECMFGWTVCFSVVTLENELGRQVFSKNRYLVHISLRSKLGMNDSVLCVNFKTSKT